MKRIQRQLAFLLVLIMAFALAGCGGSGDNSPNVPDSPASPAPSSPNGSTSPSPAPSSSGGSSTPAPGNTNEPSSSAPPAPSEPKIVPLVRIAVADLATNVTPWMGTQTGRYLTLFSMYQPLVERSKETGEDILVLAKEIEDLDGFTKRVTIYDNIYDSAGNHFTASDAVFSINGAKEVGNISGIRFIEDAEVVSDYVLDITITVDNDYQFVASMAVLFMVTEAAFNASSDGMASAPVGTGPYRLEGWVSGSSLAMVKVDNYWGSYLADRNTNPGWYWHAQNVERAEYTCITEASQASIALENGTVDASWYMTQHEAERFMNSNDYNVWQQTDTLTFNLYFNCGDQSPLSNKLLRQAICYAVDSQAVMDANGGYGLLASTFGSRRFPEGLSQWDNEDYYGYDPEKAKQLLADSGFDTRTPIRLMVANTTETRGTVAEVVQAYLFAIGIDVKIETYDGASFAASRYDESVYDIKVDVQAFEGLPDIWNQFLSYRGQDSGKNYVYIHDEHLQSLMDAVASRGGMTPANLDAAHQYIKENAFIYSLYSQENFDVTNNLIAEVVRTTRYYALPGACSYN